jgi:hypothetical protein
MELLRDLRRRLAEIDHELGELAREHPAATIRSRTGPIAR